MKILFLAPLTRKITPRITAARPRIIFDLISGLQKRNHKITILGTKDSHVPGVKIVPVIEKSFYSLSSSFENPFYAHTAFLAKMAKMAEKMSANFDIVHNHCYPEFINLLPGNFKAPIITTIHMTMTPFLDDILSILPSSYIICPSNTAKKLAKKTKVYKVIYHGVDPNLYKFSAKKEDYLLWIGRLGKAKDKKGNFIDGKGVRMAIKLAKETNSELLLSGNIEDPQFFEKDVRPHLNKKIKWLGSISFEQPLSKHQVARLMKKAKAFLMLSKIEEAFGLVTAEAQSCGTPVIGFKKGATQEIISDGKTGFIVDLKKGVTGLKEALAKIDKIKPDDCRNYILKNFSLEKMVDNYEKLYFKILKQKK